MIPIALAALAFLLDTSQSNREQEHEDERAARQRMLATDASREEALRAYLTQMSALLLDRKLLQSREEESAVRSVARGITLSTLRRVDGDRKGSVLQFLSQARLIPRGDSKVWLYKADLRSAVLRREVLPEANLTLADLRRADLRGTEINDSAFAGADLRGANLRGVGLPRADFRAADLRGADLTWADLNGARFTDADLRNASLFLAELRSADFRGANLRGADLRGADLRRAKLHGANLEQAKYGQLTQWPSDFDPAAAGASVSGRGPSPGT